MLCGQFQQRGQYVGTDVQKVTVREGFDYMSGTDLWLIRLSVDVRSGKELGRRGILFIKLCLLVQGSPSFDVLHFCYVLELHMKMTSLPLSIS